MNEIDDRLAPGQVLKSAMVASYPRSGNTWVRFLIESVTNGKCHMLKSHLFRPGDSPIKVVHLVRHPYDAWESYWHYMRDWGRHKLSWEQFLQEEVFHGSPITVPFKTEEWISPVWREEYPTWDDHSRWWIDTHLDTMRVRYEDLLAKPVEVLTGILAFLGERVEQKLVEQAVRQAEFERMKRIAPDGKFFRRGEAGLGHKQFTGCQKILVQKRYGEIASRLGYML